MCKYCSRAQVTRKSSPGWIACKARGQSLAALAEINSRLDTVVKEIHCRQHDLMEHSGPWSENTWHDEAEMQQADGCQVVSAGEKADLSYLLHINSAFVLRVAHGANSESGTSPGLGEAVQCGIFDPICRLSRSGFSR